MKRKQLMLAGVILAIIVAGIYVLSTTREHMTGKNPTITFADVESIPSGKLTSNMTALRSWISKYGPSAATPGSTLEISFGNSLATYGTVMSGLSSTPTSGDFANQYAGAWNSSPITAINKLPQINGIEVLVDYSGKDVSPLGIYTYYVYQYYFTDALPPPPAAPAAPASLAPMPAKPTLTGVTAASSSATQPSPIGAGIPSPCHPSYQSIPGGSIEYRCFS
jgi:hypothetical protein